MSNIRRGRRLDAPIDPKQPVVGTGVLDCPSGKFVPKPRNFARCASNNKAQSFLDWALLLRRVDKKDANTNMLKFSFRQRFFQQVPQFYR